ncbi:protein-tyrosine phosphatase family protein [Streptomyces sp. CBMA29]|uniref:protein-tyrosine phosphatase family protein n=1 Tax=Streptomyces sp. CBMA29 TaxID=1896314 RepID=UPI00166199F0|nr:protein-tyrosine phosphatase family protein [Streptomyces sp. CBMA29]MBD0737424.1 protein phosphatase [Streptomyces sp. CBMA29]
MTESWDPSDDGIVRFPSGVLVRGRGLRQALPAGPTPSFGVYLLGGEPPLTRWDARWVRWPDFRLPSDRRQARAAFEEALARAADERVEVACGGGIGRTGTALACMAVLDGVPAHEAVAFVRRHYHHRAVETPWQRRFIRRFDRAER